MMTPRFIAAIAPGLLVLTACEPAPEPDGNVADPTASALPAAPAAPVTPPLPPSAAADPAPSSLPATAVEPSAGGTRSCVAEIGRAAADRLARQCRNVSPATRPPCNVANSCAMMTEEIARSCALFDGQAAPPAECRTAPASGVAAADVVRRYYSALNARDYETAWTQWGSEGPPNQTRAAFEAGFARTRATRVTIGALPPSEGAAGSIFQTVPVTVDATLADGKRQRFKGDYTLRRVNGVDGATADQLRWHIDAARLVPTR